MRNNHNYIKMFEYFLHSVLVTWKVNIHLILDNYCPMSACLDFTTLVNRYLTANQKSKKKASVKGNFLELEHFLLNVLQSFTKN